MKFVNTAAPGRTRAAWLVVLAALTALTACGSDTAPASPTERDGTAVSVGQGTASAFVIQHGDAISSIGVKLSSAALNGLPSVDSAWTLPVPAGVSAPPYDHVTLNWNVQGHPPMMYMVPHFDFHFYTISPAAQAAIQGGPDTVTVPAADVPRDYVSGVQAVPDMGVHWVDTLSTEMRGGAFDHTFIYGFYHGSTVFVEPMITRAFLQTNPNVSITVKQPQAFQKAGDYPTSYSVRYDAATSSILVTLDSLVMR